MHFSNRDIVQDNVFVSYQCGGVVSGGWVSSALQMDR